MGLLQQLKADKARRGKRNVSVLEVLHYVYGKQSMGDQENEVLTLFWTYLTPASHLTRKKKPSIGW